MGETQIREYLDGVVLTAMSPDQWDDLEEELTLEEVTGAIYKKKVRKDPGTQWPTVLHLSFFTC